MRYEFIGWCHDPVENHDKVWGMIRLDIVDFIYEGSRVNKYKYVTFWGKRGKKLQTKVADIKYMDAEQMFEKKLNKDYKEIAESKLHTVYPEFQDDLEKTAVWAMLSS